MQDITPRNAAWQSQLKAVESYLKASYRNSVPRESYCPSPPAVGPLNYGTPPGPPIKPPKNLSPAELHDWLELHDLTFTTVENKWWRSPISG